MNIYDRANWPKDDENPLIALLSTDEEWFDGQRLVLCLGLTKKRSMLAGNTVFARQLDDTDTAIEARGWITPTKRVSSAHGGQKRVFSRRAVILAAMRTNTVNAAAFRDWLATRMAEETARG